MTNRNPDEVRKSVLSSIEQANRQMRTMIIVGAILEALIIAGAIVLTVWKDPLHRLVLAVGIGTWTLTGIGLIVLGGHVSRVASRVVAALSNG